MRWEHGPYLLSACLRATGATFFVVWDGWYLAQGRGIEEGAWGRVVPPKYADISCLRVAFEAGHGWLYFEGHRARVYNSSVPQRARTHPTPLNPLSSIKAECKLERQETQRINVNQSSHCGVPVNTAVLYDENVI